MNEGTEEGLLDESRHLKRVRRLMAGAGQTLGSVGRIPSIDDRRRQASRIADEAGELIGGLGFSFEFLIEESVEGFDLVETVDGALDLRVVSTGVLAMLGLPDVALQTLVDEANLRKLDDVGEAANDFHGPPPIVRMIADILIEQDEGETR
tara:strand:+ start:7369 stop:7821 length:453 start_codon:yes stop_codon:yes gene_type:complete